MIGGEGACRLIAEHLGGRVPARVAWLLGELGPCVGGADPTPKWVHYTPVPVLEVEAERWPFLLVVPVRTVQLRLLDTHDDGSRSFDGVYLIRVFCYVRAAGYDQVSSVRGRLSLAVREVILASPSPAAGTKIEAADLVEEFSDVDTSEDLGGSVAGTYLEFTVRVRETLAPATAAYDIPTSVEPVVGLL